MRLINCLALFVCVLLPTFAFSKVPLKVGDLAPNYLGRDESGNKVLLEDNKGKVVVISFWASWCTPCLKELPILESIQNKVGIDKIKVVAVNYKESVKQYRKIKNKFKNLDLTLTHDKRGNIGKKYGIKAIPTLIIIGIDGNVALYKLGYNESSVEDVIGVLNIQLAKT